MHKKPELLYINVVVQFSKLLHSAIGGVLWCTLQIEFSNNLGGQRAPGVTPAYIKPVRILRVSQSNIY